jgi:hypothetical protein
VFTAAHEDFRIASRRVNGDAEGTRQLIDVLLQHRSHTADQVVAGIRASLTVGAVTADVVAVETRHHPTAVVPARDLTPLTNSPTMSAGPDGLGGSCR